MTTGNASDISQSGVNLAGSYSEASSTPSFLGFRYGTSSSSLNSTVTAVASGNAFTATLSGLNAGTTYYYQAYATVAGTGDYVSRSDTFTGTVRSFTTSAATGSGDGSLYESSFLGHYEVPATDVTLTNGTYHSRVGEKYGSTYAYVFNPSDGNQKVVTHTYLYNSVEVCNYTMLFDRTKKCALWVAWEMDKDEHADKGVGRKEAWAYDPAIPESWQANLASGSYDGYSRGHQVASNDRQTTVYADNQTFYFSNMTPQLSTLNSGSWATLETAIQGAQTRLASNERLYVVTGPIFGSGNRTTTDRAGVSCPVPTAYYKCVMKCTLDATGNVTSAKGCGFFFEHASNAPRQTMTIDQIEALTGFDFFANIPDVFENSAEAQASTLL